MEKIEITQETVLSPGDRIEIHYKAPGATWLKATEAALIESSLERREDFRIRSINYNVPGMMIFTVDVLKTNPVVMTAGTIVMAILAVIGIWGLGFMFHGVYKIIKTVPGAISTVSLAAIGIIVALIFYKRSGGRSGYY